MKSLYRIANRLLSSHGKSFLGNQSSRRFFDSPKSTENSTERPFRILGVQQIAVGSNSRDELLHLWVDILGLKTTSTYVSEKENVDEVIISLGLDDSIRHSIEIDLMIPLDPNKSPKVHIPPLNHVRRRNEYLFFIMISKLRNSTTITILFHGRNGFESGWFLG